MFKNYIQKKLEKYVREYFAKHPDVRLVVVAGSVGKTTTKMNVATVLSQSLRVRMENTNHNTHMSAPLGMLGIEYPEKVHSVIAWLKVLRAAKRRIKQPSDVDVVVQELGTDRIGEIAHFGTYLRPSIGLVTGVTSEHMEFFGTLEAVAQEELAVVNYSEIGLINRDDIDGRFASYITNPSIDTYGTSGSAEYRFEIEDFTIDDGYKGKVYTPEFADGFSAQVHTVGDHTLRPALAAVAAACKLGLSAEHIANGLAVIRPVSGRMNVLRGQNESIIIDDTYNSSPAAAHAALQTLYSINAPQRIAIFGSMNELGDTSDGEHQTLGKMCDSGLLSWVITIGEDAEKYLAPEARLRGCQVKSFRSAIDAGAFAHSVLEENAVVLVKGSQGSIYAEEAVKILLHDTQDDHKLVRQTPEWIKTKNAFFSKF